MDNLTAITRKTSRHVVLWCRWLELVKWTLRTLQIPSNTCDFKWEKAFDESTVGGGTTRRRHLLKLLDNYLDKNACWYFVTSTSEIGSFSLVPVKASEMSGIGANNASTFHIAITGNQTIMNHESFRKQTESPVQHFIQRVFRGVIYISTGKTATKLCMYAGWTNLNEIFRCINSGKINMDEASLKHKQTQ